MLEDLTFDAQDGTTLADIVALRLEVVVGDAGPKRCLLKACQDRGPDFFLEVMDFLLWLTDGWGTDHADTLRWRLDTGGSVWTVAEDKRSLVRRVSEKEQLAYEAALSPADQIAEHLRNAWTAVYGLHPDPKTAWVEAIKAVEVGLCPTVIPKNPVKTLGAAIRDLRAAKEGKFALRLGNLDTFIATLDLIWTEPGRHGGPGPSQEAAKTAVHTAVHIVGLVRRGDFARVDKSLSIEKQSQT